MSKPRVPCTEKEFKVLRDSGAADFMARAAGYKDADDLWDNGRGSRGGLILARGPEMRTHVAKFIRGLSEPDWQKALRAGLIASLATHSYGRSVKHFERIRAQGITYVGQVENRGYALAHPGVYAPPEHAEPKPKASVPKKRGKAKAKPSNTKLEAKLEQTHPAASDAS